MDSLSFGTKVLVHLDFKGAPPKLSYIEKLFPFLREIGVTGLLIEWEDTFPYTKELMPLGGLSYGAQATGAPYSIEDAKQILNIATDCGLIVIPLVQTFGHLEFVLKHEQWRSLREVEAYPSSMCPLNSGAMPLVRSLIKQIVNFHPDLKYIHIGADEVWHLGLCADCVRKSQTSKHGRASLFLDHVSNVAQYIKDNYPTLKIIIWDDMLRNIDVNILQEYNLGNLVEPMIWHYNTKQTFNLGGALWEKYNNIFTHIWGASAFKGASGSCQILPINKHYVENHEGWLVELGQHGNKIQSFRGMVLTGWSRYDHYATLCELLPTAIPSLALCLKTWQTGGYSPEVYNSVSKYLGYVEPPLQLHVMVRPCAHPSELSFPGWQILFGIEWFANLKAKYKNVVDNDQIHTWFNQWQIVNNYTNPMQIQSILPVLKDLLLEIASLEIFLKINLEMFFYPPTTEELLDKAHLDEEFKRLLTKIRPYIINLSIPQYITSCRVWMEKLSLCEPKEIAIRNEYLSELYRQIQSGKIEEPFLSSPPDGPLLDIVLPGSSTSWSDISSTSTQATIEVPPSGDSLMEESKGTEMENYYEKKIQKQQQLIDDLHHKNDILSKQLNTNICNSQAALGINMMASEVEYLKERLRELIMMKKNLQTSHNAIIIQWESVTRELEFELQEEKQKNNELKIRIKELEEKANSIPMISNKIIREDIEKKILAEHTVEIKEKQDELIKNMKENNYNLLKQKEDQCESIIKELREDYEAQIENIKIIADNDIKTRDEEIEKLGKIVEEKCDRSQMDQETICNNDALVEKINFLQSCILKMDKLLRKYEKHYSKKVSVLTNELVMKENSMQIQLTTQRAQIMAKASTERQLEIEEIVFQLERRYRQLLEEQQFQVNEIRQDYTNIIKQLADKFEIKTNIS